MKVTKQYLRSLIRESLEEVSISRDSKLNQKMGGMAKRIPGGGKQRIKAGPALKDPFYGADYDPQHIEIVQLKSVAGALNKSGSKADIAFPGFYVRTQYGDLEGPFKTVEAAKEAANKIQASAEKNNYISYEDDDEEV